MTTSTMGERLNYIVFKTTAGWVGILSSEYGLLRSTLPQRSPQEARRLLNINSDTTDSLHQFDDLAERLRSYFRGKPTTFPDELDLSRATYFQREVWETTRLIPYGETRSYTWVAEQSNQPRAVRAAGQALARNPLPIIIPCHRIIASDGRLGGFSGGIGMKQYLLSLEATAHT